MLRLFIIGLIGALCVVGLGFAFHLYLQPNVMNQQEVRQELQSDEGYCCLSTGTCAIQKKTLCSSFFAQEPAKCEARCTGDR